MADIKDGGPAFPHQHDHVFIHPTDPTVPHQILRGVWSGGMTLRDYFAAKALPVVTVGDHVDGQGDPERHSALAYAYADAMLKAREPR